MSFSPSSVSTPARRYTYLAPLSLPPEQQRHAALRRAEKNMTENPEQYLRNAEECRQQAERSRRNDDKVRWLKLAADWQSLAKSVENGTFQTVLMPFERRARQ